MSLEVKKIVHLIFTLEVGGAENLLVDIANNQAQQASVSVIIVNNKYDKSLVKKFSKEIRIIFIERKEGSKSILAMLKIWRYIIGINPVIIHCHQQNLIKFLPFWKTKAVITVHTLGIVIKHLKEYKRVFAISNSVSNDLLKRSGVKASVIYNGISIDSVQRKNTNYLHTAQPFKIVQISRLVHSIKGQHIAIGAIKQLVNEGYTNIRLYFIGGGPSLDYLNNLIAKENLKRNVFFLGEKDRSWIYSNLKNFDLLIQPSIYEGFGLTLLEGLSAGLPVIASNIDGPAEILNDMPSGFLFSASDESDFVNVLKRVFLLSQQEKLSDLCNASYKLVQQKYTVKQTADNYLLSYAS